MQGGACTASSDIPRLQVGTHKRCKLSAKAAVHQLAGMLPCSPVLRRSLQHQIRKAAHPSTSISNRAHAATSSAATRRLPSNQRPQLSTATERWLLARWQQCPHISDSLGQGKVAGKSPTRPELPARAKDSSAGSMPGWSQASGKAGPDSALPPSSSSLACTWGAPRRRGHSAVRKKAATHGF